MERKVIDISHWTTITDWNKLKSAVAGVIMKATDGTRWVDEKFGQFADKCTQLGIPFGVYCYSQAKSAQEGLAEAEYILKAVQGYKLSYPIYFDSEQQGTNSSARVAAQAFCERIEKAGYWAGIYASESWFNANLNGFDKYTKWVAKYGVNDGQPHTKPSVSGVMGMWQYTDKGRCDGTSGNVDLNIQYQELGGGPKTAGTTISSNTNLNAASYSNEFVDKYVNSRIGRSIDDDGAYGVQCFTENHYIAMADGTYKAIQDVKSGDLVLDDDNNSNPVVGVFKHTAPVFKVKTNLTEFEVTEDHPFLYEDDTFSSIFDIDEKIPKIYDKTNEEESGLTDEELKFLGFWLGDGSLVKYRDGRQWDARITYGESKSEYVESLDIISSTTDRKNSEGSKDGMFKKTEHPELIEYIYKCYDENNQKQLPMIFTNREYELILDGYLHADGNYDGIRKWTVVSTSKKLLMSIQAICVLLGYKCCSIRQKHRPDDIITIKGKEVKSVKPIYAMNIRKDGKENNHKIVSSEFIGEQTVYNLNVDGSHTFICNNYKVHNCVDGFRDWNNYIGVGAYPTGGPKGSGSAYHYWLNRNDVAKTKNNYDFITDWRQLRNGDWVMWPKSAALPYGHIAMYYNGKAFGQNQNGRNDGFTLQNWDFSKMCGALRWKKLNTGSGSTPAPAKKPNDVIAQEVIDGKWGDGDTRKSKLQAAGYDYNTIQAIVNQKLSGATKKPNDVIAQEVIDGKWGDGDTRKQKLQAAGYDYNTIQNLVNQKLNNSKKSNEVIAQEVMDGKWGNGDDRKRRLQAAGYDYNEIQSIINGKYRKSNTVIAHEVIAGKWGNGAVRKQKLQAAGYDYNAIQKIVNSLI